MLNDGLYNYAFNAGGRQTSAAGVTYTYDGDGQRVKKSNGKLYWFGLGGAMLAETDLSGNNPTEFVFFGGKRTARRDPTGTVYYYNSDHLGSSRIITDSAGVIKRGADYQPFGLLAQNLDVRSLQFNEGPSSACRRAIKLRPQ